MSRFRRNYFRGYWELRKVSYINCCDQYVPSGKLTGVCLQLCNEAIVCLVSEHASHQKETKQFSSNFLSMQESSRKRPRESLIEEQSCTNSYSGPLHISATTKLSKVLVKKGTSEEDKVYIHIYSKQ